MQIRWKYFLILLALLTSLVWLALITFPDKDLHLIACNVGQGDAVLAIQGNTQILIDGGADKKVLDCLARHLPFWDRKIEVVVLSHPQKDHFGGLIEVLKIYDVDFFVATTLDSGAQEWGVLKELVGSRGVRVFNPVSGHRLRVGLIYLDIVWPTQEFLATNLGKKDEAFVRQTEGVLGTDASGKDPNEFSVVAILRFNEFDALLTGDIGPEISSVLARQLATRDIKLIEYIKVPHHGSKNGLTKELLDTVDPKVAVISVGKGNSYGHPHEEVLDMLSSRNVKILRTDEVGDVIIETDGRNITIIK
jgi:competence protein ComEC